MNKIINKVLLAGNKFMPEIHLRQPGFTYNFVERLLKTKKEYKHLKKQEIQDIFIKTNWAKVAFNMTWLMEILKFYLEEQPLIKYYVKKHLTLIKI